MVFKIMIRRGNLGVPISQTYVVNKNEQFDQTDKDVTPQNGDSEDNPPWKSGYPPVN